MRHASLSLSLSLSPSPSSSLSSRIALTHYFAVVERRRKRDRERDLMEGVSEVRRPTESNSGGAIIPNARSAVSSIKFCEL